MVQTFKKFGYTLIWNDNVIHEMGRPTEKWDLSMIIFVEHMCTLTIEMKPVPPLLLRGGIPWLSSCFVEDR